MKRLFPFIYVFSCLIAAQSFAGSATWNLNASRVWNSASNWTPATVPNGPQDTATFGVSQQTFISQLLSFELNGFVFNPGASAYTILLQGAGLNLDGTGIINNSGVTQNVSCNVVRDGDYGGVYFYNSATSGESVNYDLEGGPKNDFIGANVEFHDQSSAGSSVFTTHGGQVVGASGSSLYFYDESSAAHATFINNGGSTSFYGKSLTESTVVLNGGIFVCSAMLPLSDVTVTASGDYALLLGPSAQGCIFTANGGDDTSPFPGYIQFLYTFDTGDSVLTANGGTNGHDGGLLYLLDSSVVGGRVELFGNGTLVISSHDAPGVAIGSLEGDGSVIMGALNLTVGSNSLSTSFSGSLEGNLGSSLTKVGTGTLTLSGANNTYTDGTTIVSGSLKVNNATGSATGTGAVQVSGGILGGKGIIAGPVTIGSGSGTGGSLQPGIGASTPITLTLQNSLTFNSDGSYIWKLNTKKAKADKVIVSGATIGGGAQFNFRTVGNKKLTTGKVFTAISNTAVTAISGTFANLADGSIVTVGVNKLQVSYSGGDGNDLTLTVVP